ncbi:hypothetical protein F7230_08775 [Corynebacterium sp. 320]|nr:hypothetical protein F7230_08775 [Corynebacterium sp. 320]KAB1551265.1 hypothetical protein F7233_07005 [Corynebacterium sp. 321]KAB1551907.1 hypothetical protein F7232_07265 [Corynebacterium sp. 319]KAB3526121.1 hypothetical protein F8354_08775 [Corynebacterium sp. 250]KAB3538901.1 hypothetical protein F8390_07845 [Corynebacterium sp. 366]QNP92857.1 hypothetical protein IAU67_03460 [Corynebacterium zhongnanshanii]
MRGRENVAIRAVGCDVTRKEFSAGLLVCELVGNSKRVALFTATCASVLSAALTLSACGSDDDSHGAVEQPAAVAVAQTPVTLESAGAEPRESLAWFSDSGQQKVTFKATQGLEQHTEGGSGEDLPYEDVTMTLPLSASVDTDGEKRTTSVTVGRPSGTNHERNEDIASAEGFQMTTVHTADGQAVERTMAAPEGASDAARASVESALTQMNDFPVVFPSEKVGIGARWTVSTKVDAGVSMFQDITYTLAARQGKDVTLKISVDRRPAVTSYGRTNLTVLDSSTESRGQVKVDLTRALPVSGQLSVTTALTLGDGEQKDSGTKVIQKATTRGQWLSE